MPAPIAGMAISNGKCQRILSGYCREWHASFRHQRIAYFTTLRMIRDSPMGRSARTGNATSVIVIPLRLQFNSDS